MSERGNIELLSDIKEAIKRIALYIGKMDYERFLQDIKTQDAVVRNLEIIGEAAKNVSNDLKKEYPQIPWKELAGIRDRLIHHYFGVNYDIVWAIVREELPQQLVKIEEILSKMGLGRD
ncbi:MAG: DUF86 domain-containing protein [Candidatus Omnitrophica bacterium]|nr:DUF86 domain-containing protein [Candidatus Omnitrophota bacterium]